MSANFVYFEDSIGQLLYTHEDGRNVKEMFQRDKEIHIIDVDEKYKVVVCFLTDRYLCTLLLDNDGLKEFKHMMDNDIDHKTVILDLLTREAFTNVVNFKTTAIIDCDFEDVEAYFREEFNW